VDALIDFNGAQVSRAIQAATELVLREVHGILSISFSRECI